MTWVLVKLHAREAWSLILMLILEFILESNPVYTHTTLVKTSVGNALWFGVLNVRGVLGSYEWGP
jgi:hypothetical protein